MIPFLSHLATVCITVAVVIGIPVFGPLVPWAIDRLFAPKK